MADDQVLDQVNGKIWEKLWSSKEISNNSLNWSLAGDAGLLLHLKSFAEKLISKAAFIEKDLQKLCFEEKQCCVEFENVTSNFLQLENFQFIENRVYEQDLTSFNQNLDSEKTEKSKEEKEQELFEIINESVSIGMSIMDNYFDKIDGTKSENESDEENEDKNDDLVIYETKDPYVLRSLPYLIGSQAYLENDHVGLKDLEDDDEEDPEQDELDEEAIVESESESENESESKSCTDSEKDQSLVQLNKKDNFFDEESDIDDDTSIFNSTKKQNDNLFDDNDDDQNVFSSEKPEVEPIKTNSKPPLLDFASELSSKIAMKGAKQTNSVIESELERRNLEDTQIAILKKHEQQTNLFDYREKEDDLNSASRISKSMTKKLFSDDDNSEIDDDSNIFNSTKKQNNNFFETVTIEKVQNSLNSESKKILTVEKQETWTKTTLFDSEDSENENEDFFSKNNKLTNVKAIKDTKMSLFDEGDEDFLFSKPQLYEQKETLDKYHKNEIEEKNHDSLTVDLNRVIQNKVLFEQNPSLKNKLNTEEIPVHNQPVVPIIKHPKKTLFEDDDNDEDDLFSHIKKKTSEEKIKNDITEENQNKFSIKKTDPSLPNSFFDDEDEDDLFKKSKNELIVKPNAVINELFVNENNDDKKTEEKNTEKMIDSKKTFLISDLESFTNDHISESEEESVKPKTIVKNILFDPSALKSSNLFKKIAKIESSESDDQEWNQQDQKKDINKKNVFEEKKNFVRNEENNLSDLFGYIPQPIQLVNSAQKDRIKASLGKKRAPSKQQKRTLIGHEEEILSVNQKIKISETKLESTNTDFISSPSELEVDQLQNHSREIKSFNDSLKKFDTDDKINSKKSSTLFDYLTNYDDDIFKSKSNSGTKISDNSNIKAKTVKKNLFEDLDDNDDIFSFKIKPKEHKVKNSDGKKKIFDELFDDNDIFA